MHGVLSSLPPASLIALFGLAGLAVGCGASLKNATSGQIGCPPDEITISDRKANFNSSTWTATCRGETFYCSSATTGTSMVASGTTTYSSTSSQYQCRPAVVAEVDAPPAAAPAAAGAPKVAAAPAPTAPSPAPEGPPKQDFPDKALGFSFASAPVEVQEACSTRGHSWQGSGDKYECSGAGVDVGVPVRTTHAFCDGGLCELRAFATLASGTAGAEQLLKLQSALVAQYGKPDKEQTEIPNDCRATLAACVAANKARWSRTWEWSDGSVIRARLLAEGEASILGILYRRDQEAKAIQEATESLNTDAF